MPGLPPQILLKQALELGTEGYEPALVELGLPDDEQSLFKVDILDAQSAGLTHTQTQSEKDGEEDVVGRAARHNTPFIRKRPSDRKQTPGTGCIKYERRSLIP